MNGTDGAAAAGIQFSDWSGILIPGVIALAMGLVLVIALAFAVHRKSWGLGVVSAFALLVVIVSSVFALRGGAQLMQKYRGERERERVASSEDGRHHLRIPGHWKDDEELGAEAAIHVSNRGREHYLMLFSFPKGGEVTLQDWAASVNEEMSADIEDFTAGAVEERKVGDFPGIYTTLSGRVDGVNVAYHVTYLQLPEEFVYILCWTLKERQRTAFPVFDKVVASYSHTPSAAVPELAYDRTAPIPERVRTLVANQLGVPLEKVTPEAEVRALGTAHPDLLELVVVLEEEFGGKISYEGAQKLVTIADIISWAEAQKAPVPVPDAEAEATPPPAEAEPIVP